MDNFINVLNQLCKQGSFTDVMLLKGGSIGISINKISSIEEFYYYINEKGYDSVAIKVNNKTRYETPIYLHRISDFKLNRKSLIIKQTPLNNGVTMMQMPDIRIAWQ